MTIDEICGDTISATPDTPLRDIALAVGIKALKDGARYGAITRLYHERNGVMCELDLTDARLKKAFPDYVKDKQSAIDASAIIYVKEGNDVQAYFAAAPQEKTADRSKRWWQFWKGGLSRFQLVALDGTLKVSDLSPRQIDLNKFKSETAAELAETHPELNAYLAHYVSNRS